MGIADYHAITTHQDPKELINNSHEMILTLFSCIPDIIKKIENNKIFIYRQSRIKQIFELYWILSCYTAKGLCNRNHTYKSLTQNNIEKINDPDKNIFMGLFNYPILMSSDILMFDVDYIPIGPDQKQHVEMMRDISNKFNHMFKTNILNQPMGYILNNSINGLDNRKMSKSYNNTIPLIQSSKLLKKQIYKIKTNSKTIEPKFEYESSLLNLYESFSNKKEYNSLLKQMERGITWKEIKDIVYEKINKEIFQINNQYDLFEKNKKIIFHLLESSEIKMKNIAEKKLNEIKNIIGII